MAKEPAERVTVVRVEKDILEVIRDWMLQTVGVVAAIIFGTWTILAWDVAKQANVQSVQSNTLAFAAVCAQLASEPGDQSPDLGLLCAAANSVLQSSISAVGQSLFGSLTVPTASGTGGTSGVATGTSTPTSTPSSGGSPGGSSSSNASSSGLSTGEIAGLAVGVAALISALVGFLTGVSQYRRRIRGVRP